MGLIKDNQFRKHVGSISRPAGVAEELAYAIHSGIGKEVLDIELYHRLSANMRPRIIDDRKPLGKTTTGSVRFVSTN